MISWLNQPLIGGLLYGLFTFLNVSIVFTLLVLLGYSDKLFPTNLTPLIGLAIIGWISATPTMYAFALEHWPRREAHLALMSYQGCRWWVFFTIVITSGPQAILLAWSVELIIFLLGCLVIVAVLIYKGLVACKQQIEIEIKNAS